MTTNKSTSLSSDLNSFIYGISRRNFQNAPDLTKTGISLLTNFPAARDAVLEYFAMVFQDAVNFSANLGDFESENVSSPSLEAVSIIGPDLCNLGTSWAPFIAPWCISLLKDIATSKSSYNVNLQNLEPVRVLLEIATQTLTLLNPDERGNCIDMLLGSSQCEWVVGSVGRVEPWLVVPRALARGLAGATGSGLELAAAVLHYLPSSHHHHVREALVHMFQESLREDSKIEKKRDIIPYLLNLASKSDTVMKALTQDIEEILTDSVVETLIRICPMMRNLPSWEGIGPTSLVALLIRADIKSFFLLLKYAKNNQFCRQLLEYLLQKMEYECLYPDQKLPLLTSAAENIDIVREKLLTGDQLDQYSVARILILVSHQLSYEFVNTISFLLQYSRNDTTLAILVRIISSTLTMHSPNDNKEVNMDNERCQGVLKDAVENALRNSMLSDLDIKRCFIDGSLEKDQKTYLHHFCLNILKLLRWENSNKVSHLRHRPISRACEANLFKIGSAFDDTISLLRVSKPCTMSSLPEMPTAHAVADILDKIDMSGTKSLPPSVEVVMKIAQATVKYFFRCLHEDDILTKMKGTQTAYRLLNKMCFHSKLARAIALRELLETAMFREEELFGSLPMPQTANPTVKDDLLIHINQKHGPITQLTQSHTSVFHAGIIGKGPKNSQYNSSQNRIPPIFTTNIELLMGALMACMEVGVVEGMTAVSLLLVELVSPDVMYNGLPWPDEDFSKQVSIERELYMRGALERCAVARAALRRAARCRPALALASALLRALAASLLHRHRALERLAPRPVAAERRALAELLQSLALGRLLPPPLAHMHLLVDRLAPAEIVQLLRDCLWNYTRDHAPSPTLFSAESSVSQDAKISSSLEDNMVSG